MAPSCFTVFVGCSLSLECSFLASFPSSYAQTCAHAHAYASAPAQASPPWESCIVLSPPPPSLRVPRPVLQKGSVCVECVISRTDGQGEGRGQEEVYPRWWGQQDKGLEVTSLVFLAEWCPESEGM